MSEGVIRATLFAANDVDLEAALPEAEVERIVHSVMRYPADADPAPVMESLNDVGNAERFIAQHHGMVRYIPEWGRWIVWEDMRWVVDSHDLRLMTLAKSTVRDVFLEAATQSDPGVMKAISRHATISHSAPRLKAMLDLVAHDARMCVSTTALDSNPLLLGLANGVLNLKTGRLEANRPELLITRYSGVTHHGQAKCPRFLKFLKKIFRNDRKMIAFIGRVMGYCLTGLTSEQVYFFFFGFGANGKSTLLLVMQKLLGPDLAKQTPPETLMAKTQGTKQSNDLARLLGVRLVIANEVEDGSLLAESQVKQITGGDTVTARFLFKEYFEFNPSFKLIIAGNHKPVIKSTDDGIWRRTRLVDFPVSIPSSERDPGLLTKLEAELPGILNWAIKGCLDWQKHGLQVPETVMKATSANQEEMDWMGQWIADRCDLASGHEEKSSRLYLEYKGWADGNGIPVSTSTAFGRRLVERGITKVRRAAGVWYQGISIKKVLQGM
jgi:putative DNA primase/helicase